MFTEGLLIVELTEWLTEWCRGVPEKLTGTQLVKKFPYIMESDSLLPPLLEPSLPPVSALSQISPRITKRLFKVFCNLMSDGTQKHKKTYPSEPCAISPFQTEVNLRLFIGTLRIVYNKTGNVCVT